MVQKRGSEVNVDGQYEEVRTGVSESEYAAVEKPRKNNGHGAPGEYAVVDKSKKKKVRVLVSGRLTQTVYNFCLFVYCLLFSQRNGQLLYIVLLVLSKRSIFFCCCRCCCCFFSMLFFRI